MSTLMECGRHTRADLLKYLGMMDDGQVYELLPAASCPICEGAEGEITILQAGKPETYWRANNAKASPLEIASAGVLLDRKAVDGMAGISHATIQDARKQALQDAVFQASSGVYQAIERVREAARDLEELAKACDPPAGLDAPEGRGVSRGFARAADMVADAIRGGPAPKLPTLTIRGDFLTGSVAVNGHELKHVIGGTITLGGTGDGLIHTASIEIGAFDGFDIDIPADVTVVVKPIEPNRLVKANPDPPKLTINGVVYFPEGRVSELVDEARADACREAIARVRQLTSWTDENIDGYRGVTVVSLMAVVEAIGKAVV